MLAEITKIHIRKGKISLIMECGVSSLLIFAEIDIDWTREKHMDMEIRNRLFLDHYYKRRYPGNLED